MQGSAGDSGLRPAAQAATTRDGRLGGGHALPPCRVWYQCYPALRGQQPERGGLKPSPG